MSPKNLIGPLELITFSLDMKKIKPILNKNETILFTSKASLNKMLTFIGGAILSAGTFVATGIPSTRVNKKVDRGLLEIYLCLTNQRLMIWKTTWYGSPKELWMSIDLNDIAQVKLKTARMFWKLPSVKITLKNDESIGFWSAKVHKNKTLKLTKALKENICSN